MQRHLNWTLFLQLAKNKLTGELVAIKFMEVRLLCILGEDALYVSLSDPHLRDPGQMEALLTVSLSRRGERR